jgi:hypothetical protein
MRWGEMMQLDPWYVTGLVDGEGSFMVSFNLRPSLSTGIEVRLAFAVALNERSLEVLKALRRFFGCGAICYSRGDRTYKWEVRSISDIVQRVLPHFERYPLQTAKRADFERFAQICRWVHANRHRNREYLRRIIDLAYEMNPSGKRRYRKEDLLRVLG